MNNAIDLLEPASSDVFATELLFVDDSSLEFVGGGVITNTL